MAPLQSLPPLKPTISLSSSTTITPSPSLMCYPTRVQGALLPPPRPVAPPTAPQAATRVPPPSSSPPSPSAPHAFHTTITWPLTGHCPESRASTPPFPCLPQSPTDTPGGPHILPAPATPPHPSSSGVSLCPSLKPPPPCVQWMAVFTAVFTQGPVEHMCSPPRGGSRTVRLFPHSRHVLPCTRGASDGCTMWGRVSASRKCLANRVVPFALQRSLDQS